MRSWLISQFAAKGYDHAYLHETGRYPGPSSAPPQLDVDSIKALDTSTLVQLKLESYRRGLGGGKSPHRVIAHLDPQATHVVLPNRVNDVFFSAEVDGVWEYRTLQRMVDGAIIDGYLRTEIAMIDALPAGLTRDEQVRLATLRPSRVRDTGQWFYVHKESQPNCEACRIP